MNLLTHVGYLVGCDARTSPGYKEEIGLRETKTFWVDKWGYKWRKKNGYRVGGDSFPVYRLDLSTIKSIFTEQK